MLLKLQKYTDQKGPKDQNMAQEENSEISRFRIFPGSTDWAKFYLIWHKIYFDWILRFLIFVENSDKNILFEGI